MKNLTKKNLTLNIQLFSELVSRKYKITDSNSPYIFIGSFSGTALAQYEEKGMIGVSSVFAKNLISFKPSKISINTISHELSHWVQTITTGATDCNSTPVSGRNFDLAEKHEELLKSLINFMKDTGYYSIFYKLIYGYTPKTTNAYWA